MKFSQLRTSSGFALLIFLLALMGLGGIALAGFSKNALKAVEDDRFEHNKAVLEEAKQALLMFAYNYPQTNAPVGPGRLPCPDHDNDGNIDFPLDCLTVGRLPWLDPRLNIPQLTDASGETLWYAVSNTFDNVAGGGIINSDTVGAITLFDQTGAIIYDGTANGIAAIIIAPGDPISRDEDNNGTFEYRQVRTTNPQQVDPRNYLDTSNGFDNSVFVNASIANDDGFILGPIRETDPNSPANNSIVVNDQMVVITTDEIVAMAEKATLQTYRDALNEYQANIGINQYPWLESYDSDGDLGTFDAVVTPAAPNPVIGRLPSIFADYFDNSITVDSQPINPEVRLTITIAGEVHHMTLPAPGAANTFFRAADGNLVSQINTGDTFTRFFWDGHPSTPSHVEDGVWEMCPVVSGDEEDCNQDAAGNFIGGTGSLVELKTREITMTFSGGTPIEFPFGQRTPTPIEFWRSSSENPDPSNHVYIAAEYNNTTVYFSNFYYEQDDSFLNSHSEFPFPNSGTLTFGAGDSVKVGLPYYPVLPTWVLDNNWDDQIQMAYSSAVQPGGDGTCDVGFDDCLTLLNSGGITNDKLALLIQSGRDIDGDADLGLVDGGGGPNFFADDLTDIFEGENNTSPLSGVTADKLTFDRRPANGNDIVLILQ